MENNQWNGSNQKGQEEKLRLITLLERSRKDFMETIVGLHDQTIVYEESGWRVQDLLGHVAAWDRETLAAIQMHGENDAYEPFANEAALEAFNQENYQKRRGYAPEQCRMDWAMVRRDLQFAINELDPAKLDEELPIPWGGTGTVTRLIQELVNHEAEHREEVLARHQQ